MLCVVVKETSVMNIKNVLLSIMLAVSVTVSVAKTLPSDSSNTTKQPANSTQRFEMVTRSIAVEVSQIN